MGCLGERGVVMSLPDTISWDTTMDKGNKAEEMIRRWFGGKLGYNDILFISEVKNSWHGTSVCIEEDSVLEQNIKGWIYTTKADCVIFVDYENEQGIAIESGELKTVYNEIKNNYELHMQQTSKDNSIWTSTHRFIPVNKFSHTFLKY